MKPIDIVIIVLAALAFVSVIVWQIIRKKQGKIGCDCGCSGCVKQAQEQEQSACGSCHACTSCPARTNETSE